MRDKTNRESWPEKIHAAFEAHNLKELTLQEAQDQYLTLLQSYDFMFGSYFVVRRQRTLVTKNTSWYKTMNRQQTKRPKKTDSSSEVSGSESDSDDSEESDQSNNSSHSQSKPEPEDSKETKRC